MKLPPWRAQLRGSLKTGAESATPARICVVGIGNELRGDDAFGPRVIRALTARRTLARDPRLLLLEAGSAPENHTGPIRAFGPDYVLFIDAVQMGATPGAIACMALPAADGFSASTHGLPLQMLARYLSAEIGCTVLLLGVQPLTLDFGAPLSAAMRAAITEITGQLPLELKRPRTGSR